jgi:hypothetical protein
MGPGIRIRQQSVARVCNPYRAAAGRRHAELHHEGTQGRVEQLLTLRGSILVRGITVNP